MKMLDRAAAEIFLSHQGVMAASQLDDILSGFDLDKPMYQMDFWPEDVLYQFIRKPSLHEPSPAIGNWFGLAGITEAAVAINSGLAGRHLARFKVIAPFSALEGTAVKFKVNLGTAIGGQGGGTQIFIPRALLGCLEALGPAQTW
jgi:hypothetical protein